MAPTEAHRVGGGTKVSVSVSMVIPQIGSTSLALGVNSATCSPDCYGATGESDGSVGSTSKGASTVNGCSSDITIVGSKLCCGGCAKALRLKLLLTSADLISSFYDSL